MLGSHNPHAHKAELWGEERTHQPWRQSSPEDFSVRAGSQHEHGHRDTQRGNLTDGAHPAHTTPMIQEHQFQPASPDTVHAKHAKVKTSLYAPLCPSLAQDWMQEVVYALCHMATLQLMGPDCLQDSGSSRALCPTPAQYLPCQTCSVGLHCWTIGCTGHGCFSTACRVLCQMSKIPQPAVPKCACIVRIHCSPEHANCALHCSGSTSKQPSVTRKLQPSLLICFKQVEVQQGTSRFWKY